MPSSLTELIANPLLWKILVCYWIFNAATTALPVPVNGNKFYRFFYGFMHALSGNIDRAASSFRVPGA